MASNAYKQFGVLPVLLVLCAACASGPGCVAPGGPAPAQEGRPTSNFWPVRVDEARSSAPGAPVRGTAMGPFVEESAAPGRTVSAVRPLWTRVGGAGDGRERLLVLYPLYVRDSYPDGHRWTLLGGLARGSKSVREGTGAVESLEFWPFYLDREDSRGGDASYSGLFPVHGEIRGRLWSDRIAWTAFPFWLEVDRKGVQKRYFPWPFLRRTMGEGASGWEFWPVWGSSRLEGRFDDSYVLWPLNYRRVRNPGKPDERVDSGWLPFYAREQGPGLMSETWAWPFFGYTDKADPRWHETRWLWPVWTTARGTDSREDCWLPFYRHVESPGYVKDVRAWPFWKTEASVVEGRASRMDRFLVFLWSRESVGPEGRDPGSAGVDTKRHLWPLFSQWDGGDGRGQFQLLSPLEPIFPHNENVRAGWSPLFALYRHSRMGAATRTSVLWNAVTVDDSPAATEVTVGPLYSHRAGPGVSGWSLLHGLVERKADESGTRWKLFWIEL